MKITLFDIIKAQLFYFNFIYSIKFQNIFYIYVYVHNIIKLLLLYLSKGIIYLIYFLFYFITLIIKFVKNYKKYKFELNLLVKKRPNIKFCTGKWIKIIN